MERRKELHRQTKTFGAIKGIQFVLKDQVEYLLLAAGGSQRMKNVVKYF